MSNDCMEFETLELSGLVYPPSTPGARSAGNTSAGRSMNHVCEEFSLEELTLQLESLKGLPVCIEHDTSELIGEVTEATLTHSGAVRVKAIVVASTSAGRSAIRDICAKEMVGLSLSHQYELIPREGSPLKIVLDEGGDWGSVLHRQGDSEVIKRFLELSVCRDPKRIGCCIHELEGSSRVLGMVNACRKHDKTDINIDSKNSEHIRKETVSLWKVVNNSANMEAEPATIESTTNGNPSTHTECDKTSDATQATQAVAQTSAAEETSVAQPEPPPIPCEEVAHVTGDELQLQIQSALSQAKSELIAQNSASESLLQQHRDTEKVASDRAIEQQNQLDAMKSELDSLKAEGINKQLEIEAHKERDAASAEKHSRLMLSQLQDTLRSMRGKSDSNIQFQSDVTDPVKMHQQVGELAKEAIKAMSEMKDKTDKANMESTSAKRSRDEVFGAMAPFGGTATGTINASATKAAKVEYEQFTPNHADTSSSTKLRVWMQENPSALWRDIQHQFQSMNAATLTGTVNASAGMWNQSQLAPSTENIKLSAMQMQPNLFQAMSNMITGRMPSTEETIQICNSVNVVVNGPPR
jgi:hypothetical protein